MAWLVRTQLTDQNGGVVDDVGEDEVSDTLCSEIVNIAALSHGSFCVVINILMCGCFAVFGLPVRFMQGE